MTHNRIQEDNSCYALYTHAGCQGSDGARGTPGGSTHCAMHLHFLPVWGWGWGGKNGIFFKKTP